jgi:hypothetical protein
MLFALRSPGANEEFLGDDGAKIDAWRVYLVKFANNRNCAAGLNKIDI